MPTTLRATIRGSRGGRPATPAQYMMLGLAAVMLLALVVLALGNLVDNQMHCQPKPDAVPASSPRC